MPQLVTDFWRRQDAHIAQRMRASHRDERTEHTRERLAAEARRLQDAKSSYDWMLAQLGEQDRSRVESVMTREMTMLLLAVTNEAGELARASARKMSPENRNARSHALRQRASDCRSIGRRL